MGAYSTLQDRNDQQETHAGRGQKMPGQREHAAQNSTPKGAQELKLPYRSEAEHAAQGQPGCKLWRVVLGGNRCWVPAVSRYCLLVKHLLVHPLATGEGAVLEVVAAEEHQHQEGEGEHGVDEHIGLARNGHAGNGRHTSLVPATCVASPLTDPAHTKNWRKSSTSGEDQSAGKD